MKKIVAVLLVAISLLFSINFAFADSVPLSSTQWVLPSNGFGGGSRANPVDTVLPYSDMASLLSSVNSGLKSGAYSGFTGKARISYTGSFYFITLVSDGDTYWLCNGSGGRYRTEPENITTDSTTTTPSTNAPTTTPSTTEAGNGANGTYIPTHSAASNDTGLLRQIAQYTHEIWFWADLINDNLRDVRRYLFMVYSNVGRFVDGMNNITKGIYRQIDLLSGYLPRLDDIYNRLFQIQSAAWASVDVENRLLYSLEGLASNISGVIVDGAVKVTSSPDPAVAEAITGIQNTLTSVISNGKVLVDNSDVVSAIQSIPAFDDAELLSGLSALGATATRIADAIDYNFGQYSGTHTFPSLDKRQFYVYGDKAELFEEISGQVLYSSSERLSTFSYTRDYGGMTRTLYVRALPTLAQYTLELLSDTCPTAPITISKIEYRTLLGGVRYRDSIVYPVAWRYSSVANKYYAVTGFNVYYKDDPEQYPVSTSASAFENPYVYGFDSKPVDVVFSSRFTAFQQLENTRLINALSGRDYTTQLTAVTGRMDDILAQLQSTSGSATCEHTYSQHMEQEATCILPGLMISTCSKCGDSSSEIVDPLGHDWQCTSHVDAVTDPDTGEETSSAYDIYTCSRCGDTYEDHTGTGAPDEDYSNTTISQLVVKVFSKLGTFAGKLLGSVVHLFDKAVNAVDDLASKFNDYVEQIKGFGENYPIWLSGFWGIIPAELQVALTFAVICMALGVVGKKLFFS